MPTTAAGMLGGRCAMVLKSLGAPRPIPGHLRIADESTGSETDDFAPWPEACTDHKTGVWATAVSAQVARRRSGPSRIVGIDAASISDGGYDSFPSGSETSEFENTCIDVPTLPQRQSRLQPRRRGRGIFQRRRGPSPLAGETSETSAIEVDADGVVEAVADFLWSSSTGQHKHTHPPADKPRQAVTSWTCGVCQAENGGSTSSGRASTVCSMCYGTREAPAQLIRPRLELPQHGVQRALPVVHRNCNETAVGACVRRNLATGQHKHTHPPADKPRQAVTSWTCGVCQAENGGSTSSGRASTVCSMCYGTREAPAQLIRPRLELPQHGVQRALPVVHRNCNETAVGACVRRNLATPLRNPALSGEFDNVTVAADGAITLNPELDAESPTLSTSPPSISSPRRSRRRCTVASPITPAATGADKPTRRTELDEPSYVSIRSLIELTVN